MKTVRWGIIGCGAVTEVKSGPALQQTKNSEVVAVMRRNSELAEDYARRHNIPKWYSNATDLINDPDVNAVYIATPPSSHKDYVLMCAKAGKPVYVEKPMALNFTECTQMIDACNVHNIPLFVAYYRRKLPRFEFIYDLINVQHAIGNPRMVKIILYRPHEEKYHNTENLPWTVQPEISGGGIFVDLACHTLDILDFILGPITSVKGHANAQLKAYPAEDTVSASFLFANGVHGAGLWNFCSYTRHDEVEIIGDRGKINFATFGDSPIELTTKDGKQSFPLSNPVNIQKHLIESIVCELTGTGQSPSNGISGARTSWVMDQVLNTYYTRTDLNADKT